jgi:hypothetical protein
MNRDYNEWMHCYESADLIAKVKSGFGKKNTVISLKGNHTQIRFYEPVEFEMQERLGVSIERVDGKISIIRVTHGTKLGIEELPPIPWITLKTSYYQRRLSRFINDLLPLLTHSHLLHVEYKLVYAYKKPGNVDEMDLRDVYINELKIESYPEDRCGFLSNAYLGTVISSERIPNFAERYNCKEYKIEN